MSQSTADKIAVEAGLSTQAIMSSTTDLSVHGLVERSSTLSAIMVVAFISNLILLVTIVLSATLRRVHVNRHIINIAIINLLTCILGMPITLGYSVTSKWDYGDIMCKIFAHFILTTSIAMCFSIFVMNLDRVIAIYRPDKYKSRMNAVKTALLIVAVWIVAILFPLPLSLGVVPTAPYRHRYGCSIAAGSSINYLISLYCVCFALPAIANVLFFVYIAREALSEKEAESRARSTSISILWPEVQAAGVVFILFLLWILFELPYITLSSIEQYIHSDKVDGEFLYSPHLDTTFIWLKFCDSCLLPFVIFRFRKDIFSKFKDLIFCRKSNSVNDASPRQEKSNKQKASKPGQQARSEAPKFEASFPVPTLKATKDGLHVHGNADTDEEIFYANLDFTVRSSDFDELRATATIEHHDQRVREAEGEQTSDYETDPYSQSDPISVRSSVHQQEGKEFRTKANSVSHDSGHGSAASSVKKKRRKKRAVADLSIEDTPVTQDSSARDTHRHPDESVLPSPTNTAVKPVKHKTTSVEPSAHPDDRIETLESEITKTTTKKKKKKKKKNLNIIDAETNTSQVMSIEMMERPVPPPRLSPLNPDVISSAINVMATPPLRSKVPRETGLDLLPPTPPISAEKKKKRRSEGYRESEEAEDYSKNRRKKSSRPRNKSGDSERALMSSNASSEIHAVVNERYRESHI